MKRRSEEQLCPKCDEYTVVSVMESGRRGKFWQAECENDDCDFKESDEDIYNEYDR